MARRWRIVASVQWPSMQLGGGGVIEIGAEVARRDASRRRRVVAGRYIFCDQSVCL